MSIGEAQAPGNNQGAQSGEGERGSEGDSGGATRRPLWGFSVGLALDSDQLTEEEWEKIRQSGGGLILLRGQWVEVNLDRVEKMLSSWGKLEAMCEKGMPLSMAMRLLAGFGAEKWEEEAEMEADHEEWSIIEAGDELRKCLSGIGGVRESTPFTHNTIANGDQTLAQKNAPLINAPSTNAQGNSKEPAQEVEVPFSPLFRGSLRPYQREGAEWLWSLYERGLGACLADDMGLGKTVQIIAFLARMTEGRRQAGKMMSLIVAPVSLLRNWQDEFKRFAPEIRCRVFHGEGAQWDAEVLRDDVVITSYSLMQRREAIRHYPWEIVVLDEAQAIKNAASQQAKATGGLKAQMKIALTGTPIENGLSDLWSLFHVLTPGLLGRTYGAFAKGLQTGDRERSYGRLRRLMAPLVLRRMKSDERVALHLPAKTEIIQRCLLTKRQAILYAHLAEELKQQLELREQELREQSRFEEQRNARSPQRSPHNEDDYVSQNAFQDAHQSTFQEAPQNTLQSSPQGSNDFVRKAIVLRYMMRFKQLCNHPSLLNGDNVFEPEEGGKFHRLRTLAEEWASRQEKVIVFTQFREMCIPLAKFLAEIYGEPGLIMHGGVPAAQRQRDVALFQSPGGPPFYVLSLKTAGTGLTLTAAKHVVHFDRWWNPAVENQASDRIYRLGQTEAVFIHKFIVLGTLEERIQALLNEKNALATSILQDINNPDLDPENLPEFTTKGAFNAIDLSAKSFGESSLLPEDDEELFSFIQFRDEEKAEDDESE